MFWIIDFICLYMYISIYMYNAVSNLADWCLFHIYLKILLAGFTIFDHFLNSLPIFFIFV